VDIYPVNIGNTIGDQSNTYVSGLNNGDFVITWGDDNGADGDSLGIFASIFGQTGGRKEDIYPVNIGNTAGIQFFPSVSGLNTIF